MKERKRRGGWGRRRGEGEGRRKRRRRGGERRRRREGEEKVKRSNGRDTGCRKGDAKMKSKTQTVQMFYYVKVIVKVRLAYSRNSTELKWTLQM